MESLGAIQELSKVAVSIEIWWIYAGNLFYSF
jgi:hypothetical protein